MIKKLEIFVISILFLFVCMNILESATIAITFTFKGGKIIGANQGGEVTAAEDSKTKIIVPVNTFKEDRSYFIEQVSLPPTSTDEPKNAILAYEIRVENPVTRDKITNLGASITIILHTTLTQISSTSPNNLSIGFWNGLHWVPLGSKVTVDGNDVYVESRTTHLSIYGIVIKKTSDIGLKVAPNPFTPAASQYNIVYFTFNNENNEEVELMIWDLTAALVRRITMPGGNSISWDGRDEYGDICEGGVYIFQLKVGNSRIGKGTVILAK